ncbi:CLUMA_CG015268, isoform A [Clunio marinus]|uniref:CLUMA_CG015268, isoform A n=1 Tax=Clunio marinus TaxID=568069 RepID=A0A1J1INS5_9DIPT|nr:CLUMA_CG015268, isoform A [Clunio marinus]
MSSFQMNFQFVFTFKYEQKLNFSSVLRIIQKVKNMKAFKILCVVAAIIGCAKSDTFTVGELIENHRIGRILSVSDVCLSSSNNQRRYCNGAEADACDSTGFIQCNGVGNGFLIECGGTTPYCEDDGNGNAKCSAIRNSNCGPRPANYNCMSKGVFPNPLNCKSYYHCYDDGNSITAQEYQCSNLYVFDPSAVNGQYCRYTRNAYCTTVNCNNNAGRNLVLSYRYFPATLGQYIAYCQNGNQPPLVFKCEEGYTGDLSTLPVQCNINCRSVGRFVYIGDETKYYECVRATRGYTAVVQECFRGQVFNPTTKACEVSLVSSTTTTETSTGGSTTTDTSGTTTVSGGTTTVSGGTTTVSGGTTTVSADCASTCSGESFPGKCNSECACKDECTGVTNEAECTNNCVAERECKSGCAGNADPNACETSCKDFLNTCTGNCEDSGTPTPSCELECAETECYYTCLSFTVEADIEKCATECDNLVLKLYR